MNGQKMVPCVLFFVIAAQPLAAATSFGDSVPLDIAEVFLGSAFSGEPAQLYADVPADFPPIAIPADYEVLGSLEQGNTQRVVLRSPAGVEVSMQSFVDSLLGNGWVELVQPAQPPPQIGFVSVLPNPVLLCHDTQGNMHLHLYTIDFRTLVNLRRSFTTNGTCAEQNAIRQGQAFQVWANMELSLHLPQLQMPPTRNSSFIGSGGSGFKDSWETHQNLEIDWSTEQVFEHFATQVDEQGWIADARVSGALMATGSWKKLVEGARELVGIFSVVYVAEGRYELSFRLLDLSAGDASGGVLIQSVDTLEPTQ